MPAVRQPLRGLATILVVAAGLLALSRAACAQNLYPDPGFEGTGEAGISHSGQKAGHLKVGPRDHWSALGGRIDVEPFARYRVSEWVKPAVTSGTFFAPYCYEWDSYEWAFVSAHPVTGTLDWTRTEVTFISPSAMMYVHPLSYEDAENSEARVDDVVLEKLTGPAATMAGIEAKPNWTADEQRLLARWYVTNGQPQKAEALLQHTDGEARADIATVLGRHAARPVDRRRFAVEAVAAGGPTYNDGLLRFDEMTRGMSEAGRLAVGVEAVRRNPGLDRAGRSVRLMLERMLAGQDGPETVAAARTRQQQARRTIQAALDAIPADSAAAPELKTAMASLQTASASLTQHEKELGRCVIRIGGKTLTPATHSIVIPDAPTPQESYAARDLQYHLELVTGQAIPVRHQAEAGGATPLYVGRCQRVSPKDIRVDFAGLGEEGIHVRSSGPALMLAGNRRGVLYAVSTFLEDQLGCRWFSPDCSTWPKEGVIDVPHLDRRYLPPLEYRAGDYPVARPGEFALHCRLNGSNHGESEEQGGKVGVHSLAHTFASLVPPEKYFKDHPEYFSLVNGQRQSGYAQLCLTNPEVLRLAIEGVRGWIRENPGQTVFSVSQNDTAMYCECDRCAAVAKEEGSQSGPMLRFVNAVAEAIGRDHPNIAIETLAYQYTRKPPKVTRPRPNVIVCLCSIECCFIHPLGQDPYNRSFVDDIQGWSRICKRLWIWDYIINYAHSISPFPNLLVLKPNINFFLQNGVRGIYEESCYYTQGSELQELRNYIIAKTLWDPSYDTGWAMDEFCAAYYGPAGHFVREYINLIHKNRDPGLHVRIYTHPKDYVTPEMIAASRTLFDGAEAAVKDDPVRLLRVQTARLPMLYAEITLARGGAWTERDGRLKQDGGADVQALAAQFERIARAAGVTMVREGGPDAGLDAWLKTIPHRPEAAVEHLHNPMLEADLLPALGGRIWRLRLPGKAQDVLQMSGSPDAWEPMEGGYEEYSESGYRSPGWQEQYSVMDRSDRSITLQADLSNGLRLTRRIELDNQKPVLRVTSTVINTGPAARTACLRVHPSFRVSSTADASVRILRADGTWRTVALKNPADPTAEQSLWLKGEGRPAGAWEVVDPGGSLSIVNRLKPEQVGQCLLNWSGAQQRVNLEIYSPERELAHGESITLEQSYEVSPMP